MHSNHCRWLPQRKNAYEGFFRRRKTGEKPGYPRFRGEHRYDSFYFPQSGFGLAGNELKLSEIGHIQFQVYRSIQGTIKTCTLYRTPSGTWYASFFCKVEIELLPKNEKVVGVDISIIFALKATMTKLYLNDRY